jgi:hypothetical protein
MSAGLQGVATCCTQLRFLNLEKCTEITDASVAAIARGCKKLCLLNLGTCDFNELIGAVLDGIRNIEIFSVIALEKSTRVGSTFFM